jgi:hypothetical protein
MFTDIIGPKRVLAPGVVDQCVDPISTTAPSSDAARQ